MQLTSLAFALAATATAAAFVIIPELSEPDESLLKALPFFDEASSQPIQADSHVVIVPCKQCEGADTNLHLTFSVVDDTRLLLNGFELYPHADPWHGDLAAPVASADGEMSRQKLGYSLAVVPEAMGKGSSLQLLDVELRVIEVGDRFVDRVPAVNVKLFKAPSKEIIIADVDTAPSKVSGCNSMACHAKEVMADAFKAFKGFRPYKNCHGRPHHSQDKDKALPHGHGGTWNRPQSQDQAVGDGNQQPHPHRHRLLRHGRELSRLVAGIAAQILLPVLMGITAGVGVALLVMGVCSLFFQLAASVRGRRVRRLAALGVREEASASEKARLMDEAELPPQHEDSKR